MSNRFTGRNARRARFPCTEISWKRLRSSTVVQSVDGGCRSSTAVHVTRYVGCWVPRTGTLSLAFASDEVTYSQRGSTQDHVSERLQFVAYQRDVVALFGRERVDRQGVQDEFVDVARGLRPVVAIALDEGGAGLAGSRGDSGHRTVTRDVSR